jgi:hypothetical protein
MAYEDYGYDPMGNVTGYVDQEAQAIALREEEEKKRKEAEERARKENEKLAKERDNLAVHKQEVTTYANGSKTITNVAEVPATADAPGRPNVKGPVAPDEIFQNQLRAESGNRQTDRRGQIMTSPKGALGIAQIMPATAMQPGYGVPDIFTLAQQRGIEVPDRSEATARQLLANKDLNQAFGQNYSTAMRERFGDSAGVAGYNMGPGAVERNMRKNQGQFNVAQAPQETQGYLDKVMRGVGNVVEAVIPSAQAGTRQQPPANVGSSGFQAYDRNRPGNAAYEGAPQAQPFQGQTDEFGGMEEPRKAPTAPISPEAVAQEQAPIPTAGGVGIRMPGQPSGVPSSAGAIEAYQQRQDNIPELMKLGVSDDPNTPAWIKERARNRAADLVQQEREMERAKQQVAAMTPTETAKVLRKKTEEGSHAKMFIYKLLGMESSAAEESDKLGLGKEQAVMGSDGKPYLIKVGYNGKPLEGYNPETGKELTKDELIKVAAGTAPKKAHEMAEAKGSPVTKTVNGKLINGIQVYDPVNKTFVVKYGNKTDEQPEGWTPASQNVEQQGTLLRNKLMEQMRYVEPTKRMEIAAKFDQENGTNFAKQLREEMPEFFSGKAAAPKEAIAPTALPQGTQGATQAPAGGAVAPGQLPAAQAPAGQTQADILSARERKKREDEANTQVSVDARKDYNAYVDKEVVAKVPNATKISRIRSAQLDGPDGLLAVPEVAGIMASGGSAGREVSNIIRDMLTGQFTSVEDLNKRVTGLNLQGSNPKVYNALMTQVRLQQELGPLTIKETAPVGAISDSEQKMNTSNQVDITRNPAYVSFNLLSKNKFQTDLTQAKADFAAKNQNLNTIAKFNQAWTKEEGKLYKQYDDIYAARAAYVGEHKNTPLAAAAGYKLFPVPAWNAEKAEFEYKGQPYAKKRPPIDSFVK